MTELVVEICGELDRLGAESLNPQLWEYAELVHASVLEKADGGLVDVFGQQSDLPWHELEQSQRYSMVMSLYALLCMREGFSLMAFAYNYEEACDFVSAFQASLHKSPEAEMHRQVNDLIGEEGDPLTNVKWDQLENCASEGCTEPIKVSVYGPTGAQAWCAEHADPALLKLTEESMDYLIDPHKGSE